LGQSHHILRIAVHAPLSAVLLHCDGLGIMV
jgi:hypothetical protein